MLSSFLQQCLGDIRFEDSLGLRYFDQVVEGFNPFHKMSCFYFGYKGLKYFLASCRVAWPNKILPELDSVGFQSRSGVAGEECLVLVDLYL